MITRKIWWLSLCGSLVASASPSQDVPSPAPAGGVHPEKHRLPEPLSGIETDIHLLEASGNLAITAVEFGPANLLGDSGVLWTITAQRPTTFGRALQIIRYVRDVRFWVEDELGRREVHGTLLYSSRRLRQGAVDHRVLMPGDQLRLWLYLTQSDIRKIKAAGCNQAVFRPPPRRGP